MIPHGQSRPGLLAEILDPFVKVTDWLAAMLISPLVRTIDPVTEGSNSTVLGAALALACMIASRRLPAPLSALLVTVNSLWIFDTLTQEVLFSRLNSCSGALTVNPTVAQFLNSSCTDA